MLLPPERSLTGIIVQIIEDSEEITTLKITPNRKYLYKLLLLICQLDPKYMLSKKQYEKIKTILLFIDE